MRWLTSSVWNRRIDRGEVPEISPDGWPSGYASEVVRCLWPDETETDGYFDFANRCWYIVVPGDGTRSERHNPTTAPLVWRPKA